MSSKQTKKVTTKETKSTKPVEESKKTEPVVESKKTEPVVEAPKKGGAKKATEKKTTATKKSTTASKETAVTKSAKTVSSDKPKKSAKPAKKEAKKSTKKVVKGGSTKEVTKVENKGSRTRYFKVFVNGEEAPHGRFSGAKPKQAANKALTSLAKALEQNGQTGGGKINFSIVECTRGSKHKKYDYVGERVKLTNPMRVQIGSGPDAKEIVYNYSNKVMKAKSS